MKNLLFTLLFCPLILLGQFAGGTGTIGDPFQISSRAHLDSVRNYLDSNFVLTADIVLAFYMVFVATISLTAYLF